MATNTAKKRTTTSKGSSASKRSNTTAGKNNAASGRRTSKAVYRNKGRASSAPMQELNRESANPQILREAALWLILAVCILIFISYFGIGGYFGAVISDVSFGIFGVTAYLFPFLLFIAAAFLISNKGQRVAGIKFGSSLGLYLCICSFATLFTDEYQEITEIAEIYEHSASFNNGGGVIGGVICNLLRPALGVIGTGIVLAVLSIVFFVLITQKSLMRGMKRQGRRFYQSAKESGIRRREANRLERARREEEWDLPDEIAGAANVGTSMTDTAMNQDVIRLSDRNASGAGRRGRKRKQADSRNARSNRQTPQRRTEIDVPVAFPVHGREYRANRKVTGVTMDTQIHGDPEKIGTDVHQIIPKNAVVDQTSFKERQQKSTYIELEQTDSVKKSDMRSSDLEYYHDTGMSDFHIEGIGISRNDEQKRISEQEVETAQAKDSTQVKDSAQELKNSYDNKKKLKTDVSDKTTQKEEVSAQEETVDAPEAASQEHSVPSKRNPRSSQEEIEEGIATVEAEMAKAAENVRPEYVYPPLELLKKGKGVSGKNQEQEIRQTAAKLQQTLNSFGVHATVMNVSCGPSVTRYELQPEQGVKVSRIVGLSDDIKLNLAAADIRIEAPIPGKAAVGIEVPNSENRAVSLRDLLESDEFQNHSSKLAFATGKDIGGKVVVSDIAKMPHLLIAGATGSGKSVCINTLIISLLYKASPEEVKLIMIDPKVVELSVYNGIPHLFIPVVTDPKKAAGALNWGVAEMDDRYKKFAEFGVRDLKGYNQKVEALKDVEDENKPQKLPQIVIIVDELADLMMVAPGEVEDSICRLAQLARAAGIHLVIATQRPSVNVITGLIKANMPSRIAFSVSSGVDSRTIIDMYGAEKLLGKGDMLFYPQGYQKPARVQGAFVSDEEVSDVVDFLKNENSIAAYDAQVEEQIAKVQKAALAAHGNEDTDALFADAGKFIIDKDKASIGMLQRVFKIGFNRAARIMDQLSEAGVVGPEEGTKPRKVLMSAEQFENYLEQN